MKELEKRRVATEKTMARFRNREFDWRYQRTCAHLAFYQARQMGRRLPKVPRFRSAVGAKKALKTLGHDSLIGLLDAHLERIPPAMMRLGDLCAVPGTEGLDAVFVNVAAQKIAGWREDAPALVVLHVSLDEIEAAWRL
ncbi:DUF6950 family protein [Aurantiacibacter luteus]|uniref:DUF6950 domain-containing protein n=1 Tax=Aurantiacibacter luteus TaxID=1581420 RepID=A0A0G9MP14_9SPHN|nr:hypothetical protein [Aurantiacibacter luteus]KLE32461.1 hypothetical protein AAW00_13635 [Aurantiacibacter luteus]